MPRISIAFADNLQLVRKGILEVISSFGDIDILFEACSGEELIQKLDGLRTLPDICIVEYGMPRKNGYEILKTIRSRWPMQKVLILSFFDDGELILRLVKAGANGVISKNSSNETLREALHEIYYNGVYHSRYSTNSLYHFVADGNDGRHITDREIEFLVHCCSEASYKEIADKMGLSPRTVEGYRNSLFLKFNLNTRTGLVMLAVKTGIYLPN